MRQSDELSELSAFLRGRKEVAVPPKLTDGRVIGDWEIVTFLGRGASGEVYRVRHCALGTFAALKLLVKDGESAAARFHLEARLLAECATSALPSFREFGKTDDGFLYLVTELLEPRSLPNEDSEIADYLIRICHGVARLHELGYVHRDIKPGNILFRKNGDPVLIDFGLVKPIGQGAPQSPALSVVDGRAVGVGTPGYAASEQFTGGEISPATDIHALGILANECFGGNPPPIWTAIIRRATSSIPRQRYATVDEFVGAIRHRHRARRMKTTLLAAILLTAIVGGVARILWNGKPAMKEWYEWRSMGEPVVSNITSRILIKETYQDREYFSGETNRVLAGRSCSNVVSSVSGKIVRLNGRRHVFENPLRLEGGSHYWIVGPGTLDASISGAPGAVVHIGENAVFINRTKAPIEKVGVRYVLEKFGYLNFTDPDGDIQKLISRSDIINPKKPEPWILNSEPSGRVRAGGPETLKESGE